MSDEKNQLSRAGTIEITSKEGKAFLDKNLTEWKKPLLMDQFAEDDIDRAAPGASSDGKATVGNNKRGAKSTKKGAGGKKPKLAKTGTMAATAKEGAELLGDEQLGDTRQMTKAKPKSTPAAKRTNTMNLVIEEARAVCGHINSSEGRKLRKRAAPPTPVKKAPVKRATVKKIPAKKAPMKKAGTMVKTAKEGKAFLKAGKLGRRSAKVR